MLLFCCCCGYFYCCFSLKLLIVAFCLNGREMGKNVTSTDDKFCALKRIYQHPDSVGCQWNSSRYRYCKWLEESEEWFWKMVFVPSFNKLYKKPIMVLAVRKTFTLGALQWRHEQTKASEGWLESWKNLYSVWKLKISGEKFSVNQEDVDTRLSWLTWDFRRVASTQGE